MKAIYFGGIPVATGWFFRILVVSVVAGIVGCAAQTGSVAEVSKSREALLMERAQARWDAVLKNQMTEAYQFYSPASRAVLNYEDFIRSMRVGFWKAAQVEKVECQADDACDAIVLIEYVHRGSQVRTPIRETWVRTEGVWWYVQKG